jgi:hypothetical protein
VTSFRARLGELAGLHREVSVFAGPDEDHRAFCGKLTLLDHEAQDLAARINGFASLSFDEATCPGGC